MRLCVHSTALLVLARVDHVTREEGLLPQGLCLGSSGTRHFTIYTKHSLLLNFGAHHFPEENLMRFSL